MKFGFQINLDVKDRPCLVVGGGEEAADKANRLLEAGAKVTIISPKLTDEGGNHQHRQRQPASGQHRQPKRRIALTLAQGWSHQRYRFSRVYKAKVAAPIPRNRPAKRKSGDVCTTASSTSPATKGIRKAAARKTPNPIRSCPRGLPTPPFM